MTVRLQHIPSDKSQRRYSGSPTTEATIAQFLRRAGYNDKAIRNLKGKIFVSIDRITRKLHSNEKLYVLIDDSEKNDSVTGVFDRFNTLEIE